MSTHITNGAPLRVYLASSSAPVEVETTERYMRALRAHGVEVTYDWTPSARRFNALPIDERTTASVDRREVFRDAMGVRAADVVWVRVTPTKSEGAATELGVAYGMQKFILVSGSPASLQRCVFSALADRTHHSDDTAFEEILLMARSLPWCLGQCPQCRAAALASVAKLLGAG